ncbi:DUF3593 domain-containing protein [Prochlorococcus sp. MIT 1300]|uniref:DUF3593 domain-containing protein n=1 Tax=Prochlorococcus sp. MIT 1300 TaxID=3096218 RepID=UPI002A74A17F|nr:DUF3593 domain-containing protein [Prochlorococcus sp. MIT 1300]
MNYLNGIDPSPFFVLSLIPYLAFLWWAQKSDSIPKVALWGFRLTLLFVLMTIALAIVAKVSYGAELTDIDYLHGTAEAFLTLSDALVVLGFAGLGKAEVVNNS